MDVTAHLRSTTISGGVLFLNGQKIFLALSRMNETMLPLPVAYKVQKMIKLFRKEYETIESFRDELVRKYGTETEEGKIEITDEENKKKFTDDFDEKLASIKAEFPVLYVDVNDPSTFGANSVFSPKDLGILIDLGVIVVSE